MQSVTTPAQIRNNPSNNSTAKYHWSFSKSPRFKTPRPKYLCSYPVALTLLTTANLVSPIAELPSAMAHDPSISMAAVKFHSQALMNFLAISSRRKKKLASALRQIARIYFLGTIPGLLK